MKDGLDIIDAIHHFWSNEENENNMFPEGGWLANIMRD